MVPEGPHAGDMPNLHIPQSGEVVVEVLNSAVTLEQGKPNSLLRMNSATSSWRNTVRRWKLKAA
jgi:Cu/Zn superoxide dismutase